MSARLKPHPAAELLPPMTDAELAELEEDMKARGQLHKGVVLDGKVLDGRHRQEICIRLGIPFATETWEEALARSADPVRASMSPTAWVLATNLHRRNLNETQRAVIAEEALPLIEAETRARQKAGLKRGTAAPVSAPGRSRGKQAQALVNQWVEDREDKGTWRATGASGSHYKAFFYRGLFAIEHQAVDGSIVATKERLKSIDEGKALAAEWEREQQAKLEKAEKKAEKKKPAGKASQIAAKAVGASPRSVERAKSVLKKRPDLRQQLKAAKITLKQAEKAIKREEQTKQVLEYRPPAGKYAVIVTDVPWRYADQLDGSDAARSGVQYPTMTVDEIIAMKLGETKAAADCALWFWVTNAFLIDGTAARVLSEWGFEPKALLTWRKVDSTGKDRLGAGRYLRNVTEHCILATRGKPVIRGEDVPNIFDAPRRGHSEKPDEFFALVDKVCPAPSEAKIELFARKERAGWTTSGAEKPKSNVREPVIEPMPDEYAGFREDDLLKWREGKSGGLKAVGESGCTYLIGPHGQGLELVHVSQWYPDNRPGSSADEPKWTAKRRADDWERVQLAAGRRSEARAADAKATVSAPAAPKKRRKLEIREVPGE